jgi:hypothetical protein
MSEPRLSASLNIFGEVDVTAELVDSTSGQQFAAIRVGRLHVAFDLTTAQKLRDELDRALSEEVTP